MPLRSSANRHLMPDADEARRTRRRDHRRLRTELCVQETWFPQGYVQRQAATCRRKLYTVFSLHGYTKRDDGYHYHQQWSRSTVVSNIFTNTWDFGPTTAKPKSSIMARTTSTSTSTIAGDTSTSSQVFDLACEDYSNIISILGSASIVQATVAWLRGVCGLECQAAS